MSGSPLDQVSVTLFMFVTIVLTSKNDSLFLQVVKMQEATGEYQKI